MQTTLGTIHRVPATTRGGLRPRSTASFLYSNLHSRLRLHSLHSLHINLSINLHSRLSIDLHSRLHSPSSRLHSPRLASVSPTFALLTTNAQS